LKHLSDGESNFTAIKLSATDTRILAPAAS